MQFPENLLDASEEEILAEIGRVLMADAADALPRSPKELIELARVWSSKQIEKCQAIICPNGLVRELASEGFSVQLAIAVASLIESVTSGSAAIPLAYLICKRGIADFCSNYLNVSSEVK